MDAELRARAEAIVNLYGDLPSVTAVRLAKAYLAAYPADDAEPVTVGWLQPFGFAYAPGKGERSGGYVVGLSEADERIGVFGEELRLIDSGGYFCVEVRSRARPWHESVGLKEVRTRGEARKLFAVLGVPTT